MNDQDNILHSGYSGANSSLVEENFKIYLNLKNNLPDPQINGLMAEEEDDE
jgi:hypothetical protein